MESASLSKLPASLYLFWSLEIFIFIQFFNIFGTRRNHTPVHERQDVQHRGHVRVVVPRRLFQIFQGLFAERDRHLVPALTRVLNDEVVQRSEPGKSEILVARPLARNQSRPKRSALFLLSYK